LEEEERRTGDPPEMWRTVEAARAIGTYLGRSIEADDDWEKIAKEELENPGDMWRMMAAELLMTLARRRGVILSVSKLKR
jgi:hypothetical protein